MPKTLSTLAALYGTDKGPNGHGYTVHYERLFAGWRSAPVRLLEVGVWRGASLRMWADWFSNGEIVGVDIDPEDTVDTDRVSTVVADIRTWEPDGMFDIVVDDGSHSEGDILAALCRLWPHLAPAGIYAVEDTVPAAVEAIAGCVDHDGVEVFPSTHTACAELNMPWQLVTLRKRR